MYEQIPVPFYLLTVLRVEMNRVGVKCERGKPKQERL